MTAASETKGVQSNQGVSVTLKHYITNNQETNRNRVDTIVNERALREIYLKGFEIAVKSAQPMALMTSYNLVNGIPAGHNYDLCTDIARGEWGFQGLVMTDWGGGQSKADLSMHAGNDLIMPGSSGTVDDIVKAVSKGIILEEDVKRSAANVLKGIISSRIYQGYLRKQRESGV